jgi:phosphoribosyl-ATP pyrophosphohydrolase
LHLESRGHKREGSGSVIQCTESEDPDPYQNITNPELCLLSTPFLPAGSSFQQVKNGELEETAVLKGKGKGKGKGKSNLVHAKPTEEEQEVAAAVKEGEKEKKNRKSATEIYHSLLKSSPESGDEESEEDSEDEEFGGGEFRAQETWEGCGYSRARREEGGFSLWGGD